MQTAQRRDKLPYSAALPLHTPVGRRNCRERREGGEGGREGGREGQRERGREGEGGRERGREREGERGENIHLPTTYTVSNCDHYQKELLTHHSLLMVARFPECRNTKSAVSEGTWSAEMETV